MIYTVRYKGTYWSRGVTIKSIRQAGNGYVLNSAEVSKPAVAWLMKELAGNGYTANVISSAVESYFAVEDMKGLCFEKRSSAVKVLMECTSYDKRYGRTE